MFTENTEDYVSLEIAKLLRENGFDWVVSRSFLEHDNIYAPCDPSEVPRKDAIAIPTLQMAMKWLRRVHKWHIEISRGEYGYFVHIVSTKNLSAENYTYVQLEGGYNLSYEEACEAGIEYCLENLI